MAVKIGMSHTISEALNFYKTPAIRKYWMIMPDTGILIANKYGVIVHFLSKDESSVSFPLWSGPPDFPNHPIINITVLNGSSNGYCFLVEEHAQISTLYWMTNIVSR
uniref:Uncharacterized protein n=1 Tax=Lactuca sativa TaxID=4236 RepID=A0A9R1XTM5_LACSA|nr:hypothetical protein LSAT_V11C100038940 [Lactuca sativa]